MCFLFLEQNYKEASLVNLSVPLLNTAQEFNGMGYIGLSRLPHFLSMRSMPVFDKLGLCLAFSNLWFLRE